MLNNTFLSILYFIVLFGIYARLRNMLMVNSCIMLTNSYYSAKIVQTSDMSKQNRDFLGKCFAAMRKIVTFASI